MHFKFHILWQYHLKKLKVSLFFLIWIILFVIPFMDENANRHSKMNHWINWILTDLCKYSPYYLVIDYWSCIVRRLLKRLCIRRVIKLTRFKALHWISCCRVNGLGSIKSFVRTFTLDLLVSARTLLLLV